MSRNPGLLTQKQRKMLPPVRMTTGEAEQVWIGMTHQQKLDFVQMYQKLINGELMLTNVNVDENERIKSIEVCEKNRPSASDKPFYRHFDSNTD